MIKEDKAIEYVQNVTKDRLNIDAEPCFSEYQMVNAWLAGYKKAQQEVFDDILEHNKDVLERLKNNVPPPTESKYKNLDWKDIRQIVLLADNMLDMADKKELLAFGQEGYYRNILDRLIKIEEYDRNKSTDK